MDYARVSSYHPRPGSSSSRSSSFGSRHKSPLSISSSVTYDSTTTTTTPTPTPAVQDASSYFPARNNQSHNNNNNPNRNRPNNHTQDAFTPIYYQYAPPPSPTGRDAANANANAGQHIPPKITTLRLPPRLSSAPGSPTARAFNTTAKRYVPPRMPGDGFKKLPEEILLVILGELRRLHLGPGSLSCATCCMRDLFNVSLVCWKWWAAVKVALYENIQIIGTDSPVHTKKKFKIKHGTRLKLLRRTLRARPDLARNVKVLKVPIIPETAKSKKEEDEYIDLVASLIMACPNLERFPGFYPAYDHEFSRFVHALSTRPKLTERVWIIDPSFSQQHRMNVSEDPRFRHLAATPTPLLPAQASDFLSYHSGWPHLQTLILEANPGGMVDSKLFTQIFQMLPSLQNLHVSSFPIKAFNDDNMLALPSSLKKLRLENLAGVTSSGLSAFASTQAASGVVSLSLISLPDITLPVLARLFSHLTFLESFVLWQPYLAPTSEMNFIFHPYFASRSLKFLHWEITNPESDTSTEILASSISANGFPSLRTIRAPTDYEGILQQLCKPRDKIELSGDRYRNLRTQDSSSNIAALQSATPPPLRSPYPSTPFAGSHRHSNSRSSTTGRSSFSLTRPLSSRQSSESLRSTNSTFTLPTSPSSLSSSPPPLMLNTMQLATPLSTARRLAQQRIDTARTQPKFQVIAWDEDGKIVERVDVGSYLGIVGSKIHYSLLPNIEGSDESLVTVRGPCGLFDVAEEATPKDGCTGSWMLDVIPRDGSGAKGAAARKEYWSHIERGRWRELSLDIFF
ncbi:hypothetical protein F5884DRAFT_821574 [Xylogone sp. PMI_703]|nr:hypothetical protein F5884DRAFT_821574 [Xylogone sp. PMI_703]